jgi:hypothetical protein
MPFQQVTEETKHAQLFQLGKLCDPNDVSKLTNLFDNFTQTYCLKVQYLIGVCDNFNQLFRLSYSQAIPTLEEFIIGQFIAGLFIPLLFIVKPCTSLIVLPFPRIEEAKIFDDG